MRWWLRAAEAEPEWTAERALSRWRPMVRPVQHVGVPGFQFQAGVMWDGALVFGPLGFRELKVMQAETAPLGDSLLHLSVAVGGPPRFVDRKASGRAELHGRLEGGRLPIPAVETTDDQLVWRETVFAHLPGKGLVPEARYRVTDLDSGEATEMRGAELMAQGLPVEVRQKPAAVVLV